MEEKGLSEMAAVKETNDIEDPGTVKEHVNQN